MPPLLATNTSDIIAHVTIMMRKMGMQPILPVTVPVKKIKDATCQ